MSFESLIGVSAVWLWEQYGKSLTDKAVGKARTQWEKFSWGEAERKYRERLVDIYGITRLLGFSDPVAISAVFVDTYVLPVSSIPRYSLNAHKQRRQHVLRPLLQQKRSLIIGKAGSGKTTLLKYLLLLASQGKIKQTPVFVSLKEWHRSKSSLFDFIVREFEICEFPNPQLFVEYILAEGNAILLLDGLDEIPLSDREEYIWRIVEFERRYPQTQIILTSRPPLEYVFERFDYFEIAEFDMRQIHSFVNKWFGHSDIATQFITALQQPQHKVALELAHTPLFLAFLCLVYKHTAQLPHRKTDLLGEVLDILLRKWDNSRLVHRVNSIRSPQMLLDVIAYVAFQGFTQGSYLLHKEFLLRTIEAFGKRIGASDACAVLDDITSRGILVEEKSNIFSFAYVALQEYLAAYHLFRNPEKIEESVTLYASEQNWENVWIMLASLFDNVKEAAIFYQKFAAGVHRILPHEQTKLNSLLEWCNYKSQEMRRNDVFTRAFLLYIALAVECARSIRIARDATKRTVRAIAYTRIHAYNLLKLLDKSRFLEDVDVDFEIFQRTYEFPAKAEKIAFYELNNLCNRFGIRLELSEVYRKWPITAEEAALLSGYIKANIALYKTLSSAQSEKSQIESVMLTR